MVVGRGTAGGRGGQHHDRPGGRRKVCRSDRGGFRHLGTRVGDLGCGRHEKKRWTFLWATWWAAMFSTFSAWSAPRPWCRPIAVIDGGFFGSGLVVDYLVMMAISALPLAAHETGLDNFTRGKGLILLWMLCGLCVFSHMLRILTTSVKSPISAFRFSSDRLPGSRRSPNKMPFLRILVDSTMHPCQRPSWRLQMESDTTADDDRLSHLS